MSRPGRFALLTTTGGYQYGYPVLRDQGLTVTTIADRFAAGESIAEIVQDFGVSAAAVEDALRLVVAATFFRTGLGMLSIVDGRMRVLLDQDQREMTS